MVISVSLPSRKTQHPNFYRHFRYEIFENLIAPGYDYFQKCTCLYSRFERPYIANHLRWLVGFNERRVEAAYSLKQS